VPVTAMAITGTRLADDASDITYVTVQDERRARPAYGSARRGDCPADHHRGHLWFVRSVEDIT